MLKDRNSEDIEIINSNIDFIAGTVYNALKFTIDVDRGGIVMGEHSMQSRMYMLPFQVIDMFMFREITKELNAYNLKRTFNNPHEYIDGLNEIVDKWKLDKLNFIRKKVIETICLYDLTDELSSQTNISIDLETFEKLVKENNI